MGIGVSGWKLANKVSALGHLGVVSSAALDAVFTRRLQMGDEGGHLRRALASFPIRDAAQNILKKYFIEGGKEASKPFLNTPMPSATPGREQEELWMAANFCEVFLAKEGHNGVVGINFLEKIQPPLLASMYGTLLAGIDYIIVGAGIPSQVPAVLDRLMNHEKASYKLHVEGALSEDDFRAWFDPAQYIPQPPPQLKRPRFLAIVASTTLATALMKRCGGHLDGFIIEGPTAGGHNAPPRGTLKLDEHGQPIYGERDEVDLDAIKKLERPFWLAGNYGDPAKVCEALSLGAAGVQVGTAFAFSTDSGMSPALRDRVIDKVLHHNTEVFTDPIASTTGFPFKVVKLEGTMSEESVWAERPRICDLGYLRHLYKRDDGQIGYRCPGEPVQSYVAKGGLAEDTCGRKCLCNGLMATIGLGQIRPSGYQERPIVTAGDALLHISKFFSQGKSPYSASDVVIRLDPESGAG